MIGEDAPIRSVITELDGLAEDHSGATERHIEEARDQAEFYLQAGLDRLLSGLQKEIERSENRRQNK